MCSIFYFTKVDAIENLHGTKLQIFLAGKYGIFFCFCFDFVDFYCTNENHKQLFDQFQDVSVVKIYRELWLKMPRRYSE